MSEDSKAVLDRIDREKEGYLEELKEFLRIPSMSTEPAHKDDVLRCAEFLAGRMRDAGLDVETIETAGNPLVYGEWTGAPGKPTILFYGHYDVQPPDPLEEWRNPPFEPTVEGDELVARGATDDKGQLLHPRQGGGGDAGRARRAAGERQVPDRGRGGGRRRGDREVRPCRRRRQAGLRRGGGLGLLDVRAGPAVAALRAQGPVLHGDPRHRPEPRPALGDLWRRRRQPRQRPVPDRRAAGRPRDRPGAGAGLLRRGQAARGLGAPGVRRPAVRRGRVQERARRPRPVRRSRATPRSSGSGRGRPATSTACGAAIRGPAPRPCCRPRRAPRCRCGWCPTRIRR